MRIDAALTAGREKLNQAGIATAALDARLLLLAAAEIDHIALIAEPAALLTEGSLITFEKYIARRLSFEPVSRILGSREFYGRNFIVTPDVLDPRADTECVVDLALKYIGSGRFIDLGTGTGAIAITLILENNALSGIATDVSGAALNVAQQNAKALHLDERLQFSQSAWFEAIAEKFDLIISNPPYIQDDAKLGPDVANYDPYLALFGGEDGLCAYRVIAREAANFLSSEGKVVLEIGFDQAQSVTALFEQAGFHLIEKVQDLGGCDRGLAFCLNNPILK